jgi:D-alanyl-D-alanine carboxypeptidase/D-alanyl-D-alanine-endopeptidase (penicillin-binding protein 4)
LQLLDRNVATERQVRAVWASLGGSWRRPPGGVREAVTPVDADSIALHLSRTWGEVLRPMNKQSDNALTRLLYLQLGVNAMARDADTPTLVLAQREVERWFDEQRIDRTGLVLDNGSGLSRSERITPRSLAQVLKAAHAGKHAPELLMSLPVAGVDGTMRRRLKGTPAEGWARLKDGTLKNVVAIAGYVRDTRGDTWAVVAMVNHDQASKGRGALDALVEWVAKSGARWRQ